MTSRYASIASRAIACASSTVSPCVTTLGSSGTNTLNLRAHGFTVGPIRMRLDAEKRAVFVLRVLRHGRA
jgi:hypothetical protein